MAHSIPLLTPCLHPRPSLSVVGQPGFMCQGGDFTLSEKYRRPAAPAASRSTATTILSRTRTSKRSAGATTRRCSAAAVHGTWLPLYGQREGAPPQHERPSRRQFFICTSDTSFLDGKTLKLGDNQIGDEGTVALAEAVGKGALPSLEGFLTKGQVTMRFGKRSSPHPPGRRPPRAKSPVARFSGKVTAWMSASGEI